MFLLFLSVPGENVYRCPPSSDYTAASFSFHPDRYNFSHWQDNRALSPSLQPSDSSSPKPKLRPKSREDWSPAAGQFVGPESHPENALVFNKQGDPTDKDAGVDSALSAPPRKSQFEPLDLSCRPDSVPSHSATSPAVLQMSGLFNNGLSSSITRRLQSYSHAPAELCVKPAYQCDLLVQGTKEEMSSQNAGSTAQDDERGFEDPEEGREDKSDNADKWKMLKNDLLGSKEPGLSSADFEAPREKNQNKMGQWGRVGAETSLSSFEGLTPGPADPLMHQGALLSFLRSPGNLNSTSVGAQNASVNGGGNLEKDAAAGEHELIYTIQ